MRHPLYQFQVLPGFAGQKLSWNITRKRKNVWRAGFVYYFNPSSAVACFIKNAKGELLLVRRGKEPAKGTLDLPGGFVDMLSRGRRPLAGK